MAEAVPSRVNVRITGRQREAEPERLGPFCHADEQENLPRDLVTRSIESIL